MAEINNTNTNTKRNLSELSFSIRRKKTNPFYNTRDTLSNYFGKGNSGGTLTDLSTFDSGAKLDPYFRNPAANLTDAVALSNTLYATNKIYASILDYLAGMYYWRYKTVPRKVADSQNGQSYKEVYAQMLEVVEGTNIETVLPRLLLTALRDGRVSITTMRDTKTRTMSTIILPHNYCRPTTLTQHNTLAIEFNLDFFDSLGFNAAQVKEALEMFPNEIAEGYRAYKKSKQIGARTTEKVSNWLSLDPRTSTAVSLNDIGFPTYLSVFYDIIDYKTYKINELLRNASKLDTLITQELDLEKLSSTVVVDDIQGMHSDLAEMVDDGSGTRLLTSLGKLNVHQMEDGEAAENKVLRNTYASIFDNAGLNTNLFTGDTKEALTYSIKRDLVFVWNVIEKFINFYNLAINNQYRFGNYQAAITFLPLSPYNETEKLLQYRQNATLGVGILDYVIASGTKQIEIEATLELDEHLKLYDRLQPLRSSHTQSSTGGESQPKSEERDAEPSDKQSGDDNNK